MRIFLNFYFNSIMPQPRDHCLVHITIINSIRKNVASPHWTCNYCHGSYSDSNSRIKLLKLIWDIFGVMQLDLVLIF